MTTTTPETKTRKIPLASGGPSGSPRVCSIQEMEDGSAIAAVRIDADVLRRIKRRAEGHADLADFVYENILRRALGNYAFTGGV